MKHVILLFIISCGSLLGGDLLRAGDKAPNFTLPDENGTKHSLDDYSGSIVVLYFYRDELKHFLPSLHYFKCGFFLLCIMVSFDMLSNKDDILSMVLPGHVVPAYRVGASILEDWAKLCAGGSFLAGFYAAFKRVSQRR